MGCGVIANIYFLSDASTLLRPSDFAVLVVSTNLAMMVQALDFGLSGSVVNLAARAGVRGRSLNLAPVLAAVCTVSVMVGICALTAALVTAKVLGQALGSALLVSLIVVGSATVASIESVFLAYLLGRSRATEYYFAFAVQPLLLGTLTYLSPHAVPPRLAFALSYALALVAPGGVAVVRCLQIGGWSVSATVRETPSNIWASLRQSSTLGVSQLAGTAGFSLTPTLVGWAGGPGAVALYAIPHRMFMAAWSLVGVYFTANWGLMARKVAEGPQHAEVYGNHVNRVSAATSFILATGLVATSLLINHVLVGRVSVSVLAAALMATALIFRGSYLGSALHIAAAYPSGATAAREAVAASAIGALVVVGSSVWIWAGGAGLILYSLLDRAVIGLAKERRRNVSTGE